MKFSKLVLIGFAAYAGISGVAFADDGALAPRQAPAKTLPVPTDVSP